MDNARLPEFSAEGFSLPWYHTFVCACVPHQLGWTYHPVPVSHMWMYLPTLLNTGLSKHGDPVFPHFCPLNQNLTRVRTKGVWEGGRVWSNH